MHTYADALTHTHMLRHKTQMLMYTYIHTHTHTCSGAKYTTNVPTYPPSCLYTHMHAAMCMWTDWCIHMYNGKGRHSLVRAQSRSQTTRRNLDVAIPLSLQSDSATAPKVSYTCVNDCVCVSAKLWTSIALLP